MGFPSQVHQTRHGYAVTLGLALPRVLVHGSLVSNFEFFGVICLSRAMHAKWVGWVRNATHSIFQVAHPLPLQNTTGTRTLVGAALVGVGAAFRQNHLTWPSSQLAVYRVVFFVLLPGFLKRLCRRYSRSRRRGGNLRVSSCWRFPRPSSRRLSARSRASLRIWVGPPDDSSAVMPYPNVCRPCRFLVSCPECIRLCCP